MTRSSLNYFSFKVLKPAFMLLLGVMAVSFGGIGCGQDTSQTLSFPPTATACSENTAEILVGDGFLQTLCGCTGEGESVGTVFSAGNTLTCHLASESTTVFFVFIGVGVRHQIIPSQAGTFESSAIFDPANPSYRSYAVQFSASGTYGFSDQFVANVNGNIIVP